MEGQKQLTDIWSGKKTDYRITDEYGEESSLRLPKWVADILQRELPDVHAWLQQQYPQVAGRYPDISRRARGNLVRHVAESKARKSSLYVSVADFL